MSLAFRCVVSGAAFVLASSSTVMPAQPFPQGARYESLAGAWIVNADLSDTQPSGTGSTAPPRMLGRSGGGRDDMARQDPRPSTRLTITVTAEAVTLVDGDGASQTFATNNKDEKHYLGDRTVTTKTRWDNRRLVKEISIARGLTRVETYSITPGTPSRLQVVVAFKGGRGGGSPEMKYVYDRVTAR